MNPEDPFYADGVNPSLRAVALRVGEASELEMALFTAQGAHALQIADALSSLAQHLKRYACELNFMLLHQASCSLTLLAYRQVLNHWLQEILPQHT
jgi:hypothetical protein